MACWEVAGNGADQEVVGMGRIRRWCAVRWPAGSGGGVLGGGRGRADQEVVCWEVAGNGADQEVVCWEVAGNGADQEVVCWEVAGEDQGVCSGRWPGMGRIRGWCFGRWPGTGGSGDGFPEVGRGRTGGGVLGEKRRRILPLRPNLRGVQHDVREDWEGTVGGKRKKKKTKHT